MINLVSNECCAGMFYEKELKCKHQNPFIWNTIHLSEFIKLIQNFDNINFNNIELSLDDNIWKDHKNTPKLILDNTVTMYYTHYFYCPEYDKITYLRPEIDPHAVGSKDILTYIHDKWFSRLSRMNTTNTIFVYNDKEHWNDCDINKYLNQKTKYSKIFVTHNTAFLNKKFDNTYIIHKPTYDAPLEPIIKNIHNCIIKNGL